MDAAITRIYRHPLRPGRTERAHTGIRCDLDARNAPIPASLATWTYGRHPAQRAGGATDARGTSTGAIEPADATASTPESTRRATASRASSAKSWRTVVSAGA